MKSITILILGMLLAPIGRLAFEYIFNYLLKTLLMTETIKKETADLAKLTAYNEKRYSRNAAKRINEEGGFVHTIGSEEVSAGTWKKYVGAWMQKKNEQAELAANYNLNVSRINHYRNGLAPGAENPLKLYYETILEQAKENIDKYQEEIPESELVTFPQSVIDPSITPPPSRPSA